MWYKVRELCSKGLNKTQIGRCLGVDRSTVRRYLAISREEFIRKQNSHRRHKLKLGRYEEYAIMSRFIEYSNNIFFDVMLTVWRNVERRDKM